MMRDHYSEMKPNALQPPEDSNPVYKSLSNIKLSMSKETNGFRYYTLLVAFISLCILLYFFIAMIIYEVVPNGVAQRKIETPEYGMAELSSNLLVICWSIYIYYKYIHKKTGDFDRETLNDCTNFDLYAILSLLWLLSITELYVVYSLYGLFVFQIFRDLAIIIPGFIHKYYIRYEIDPLQHRSPYIGDVKLYKIIVCLFYSTQLLGVIVTVPLNVAWFQDLLVKLFHIEHEQKNYDLPFIIATVFGRPFISILIFHTLMLYINWLINGDKPNSYHNRDLFALSFGEGFTNSNIIAAALIVSLFVTDLIFDESMVYGLLHFLCYLFASLLLIICVVYLHFCDDTTNTQHAVDEYQPAVAGLATPSMQHEQIHHQLLTPKPMQLTLSLRTSTTDNHHINGESTASHTRSGSHQNHHVHWIDDEDIDATTPSVANIQTRTDHNTYKENTHKESEALEVPEPQETPHSETQAHTSVDVFVLFESSLTLVLGITAIICHLLSVHDWWEERSAVEAILSFLVLMVAQFIFIMYMQCNPHKVKPKILKFCGIMSGFTIMYLFLFEYAHFLEMLNETAEEIPATLKMSYALFWCLMEFFIWSFVTVNHMLHHYQFEHELQTQPQQHTPVMAQTPTYSYHKLRSRQLSGPRPSLLFIQSPAVRALHSHASVPFILKTPEPSQTVQDHDYERQLYFML